MILAGLPTCYSASDALYPDLCGDDWGSRFFKTGAFDALYPDLCGDDWGLRLRGSHSGDALYPDLCGDDWFRIEDERPILDEVYPANAGTRGTA